ncbi:MAG: tRNA 2-thiouridine(34) synthase MnmA [Flavobacteriales bacterium]|nr:tRNA 2-thiouridine(34) synthase MnmA [Flavobacteriales bacterium]|tara:strand:- start:14868 stop:16016 length:1149 start_codon:yes stop_codon:yes gene_type:complete
MKKKTVVIALSGGVDSSVSALLLKNAGYNLIALFMRNWHDNSLTINNECPWITDSNDALQISNHLNIPFQIVDLSKEYKKRIIDYMIAEYKRGVTPNPDILCNKEIKFDVFLKYAMQLNADFIATGHYCIKERKNGLYYLKQGKDQLKDQSYFLCQITQKQLSKILFPIGHLTKKEVRQIAIQNNLITANKKDSQGLCFVGKIKLPVFLQNKITSKKGNIIEIDKKSKIYQKQIALGDEYTYTPSDGEKIGTHNGAHNYTIGQRKGLSVGGKKEPLFVLRIDVKDNVVYVGMGDNHPGLFRKNLKIDAKKTNWLIDNSQIKSQSSNEYMVRIRHRQPLQKAILKIKKEHLYIIFQTKQRAIAKGQFAAWYKNAILIGSGPIV